MINTTLARRARDDEFGFVAIELALGVGLLLLPVTLLVLTFPTWAEYQSTARVAAQEAARTAVLAQDLADGQARGEELARQIFSNHGLDRAAIDIRWSGAETLGRGATVTAHVTVRMPALDIPGIGRAGRWSWTASHGEQIDQYRSVG